MSEEDDRPNKQIEPIHLDIGVPVTDQIRSGKAVWVTIRELGKGAFGTVYHVVNKANKHEAALKIETKTAGDNLLKIEREIMYALKDEPSAIHVFDDGVFGDYRFIVMTLCGLDLEKVFIAMNGKFRQETVLRVAIRTLLAIKILHEAEYVHRDLKPCNFALDYQPTSHNIYLFDYGMARKYARKEKHGYMLRRPRVIAQFRGTIQYCSLNMHKLKELGRVDDLWSWLFMAAEMVVPLPWNKVQRADLAEFRKEDRLKDYFSNDPFLASAFQPIYHLLGTYDFPDRPDYAKIFDLLHTKLKEIGGTLTGPMEYDAIRLSPKQDEEIKSTMKSLHLNPREPPKVDGEQTVYKKLTVEFNKPGVPGGQRLLMPEAADFFGNLKIAEERTDEMPKKKPIKEGKEPQSNLDAKKTRAKMLPGSTKPSTTGAQGASARSNLASKLAKKGKTGKK